MNNSLHLTHFRELDISFIHNSYCTFLIVCSVRLTTMLCRFEPGKSVFLFARFTKCTTKCCLQIHLFISKCKTVYFFKIRIVFLVFSRCYNREFPSCFITLNLIRKHKIIDLTTTAKGLRKHNTLFSCRIYAILNCFVCHFSSPVTLCTV